MRRYKLACDRDDDKPCQCCGRICFEVGGYHRELGIVCDGCWRLLDQPIIPGMNPVAFLEGWPYRAKRM